MELFDIIGKARDRGIDVNNHIRATSQAIDWDASKEEYENAAFELTGSYTFTASEQQAKLYYAYLIHSIVYQHTMHEDGLVSVSLAVTDAQTRVRRYFDAMNNRHAIRWERASDEFTQNMIEKHRQTYVRPSSKQDKAVELYKRNSSLPTKDIRALFVTELKLTPNGAATYLYNVRRIIEQEQATA